MSDLPDKLSDLMELALADLARVEKSDEYVVRMSTWHRPSVGKCSVCYAGAVMAGTLGVSPRVDVSPSDFDPDTSRKLCALDYVGSGYVDVALHKMLIDPPRDPYSNMYFTMTQDVRQYSSDPAMWREDMRMIIENLRRMGL